MAHPSICSAPGKERKGTPLRFLLTQWRRMVVRRDILYALIDGTEKTFRQLARTIPRCPMLVVRELRYLTALGFVRRRKDSPCTKGRKTRYYYRINPDLLFLVAPAVRSARHSD